MKRLGIIDIGSNSVRLVVVELGGECSYRVFDELKETVRLGDDLDLTGELNEKRIDKAIKALKMFKNLCDAVQVEEVIAVATAAVRKATNRDLFLTRVQAEVGFSIRVLSGEEEAHFAFWGVINSIDFTDGLVMDIGGGSTELIWVQNRQIHQSVSLPFGAITLTERFELSRAISEEQESTLRTYLIDHYHSIPWLKEIHHPLLIGVGGTFRNLGKIDRARKHYPLETTHNYRMASQDLIALYHNLRGKTAGQRKKIAGLSKDRADIILGATAAIAILVEMLEATEIAVSGSGIREGLIFDYLLGDTLTADVLDFSINNIMTKFHLNKKHASHICHLTQSLFDQLTILHRIENSQVSRLIKTAALLHDCGTQIRYYNHHEHSFYIILNSAINGLTHRELLMSAYIAALHRKDPVVNLARYDLLLDKADQEVIQKIGILLRIAESLDRGMTGIVQEVHCEIVEDTVTIRTISEGDPELAIYNAMTAAKQFEKIYGKRLVMI